MMEAIIATLAIITSLIFIRFVVKDTKEEENQADDDYASKYFH